MKLMLIRKEECEGRRMIGEATGIERLPHQPTGPSMGTYVTLSGSEDGATDISVVHLYVRKRFGLDVPRSEVTWYHKNYLLGACTFIFKDYSPSKIPRRTQHEHLHQLKGFVNPITGTWNRSRGVHIHV